MPAGMKLGDKAVLLILKIFILGVINFYDARKKSKTLILLPPTFHTHLILVWPWHCNRVDMFTWPWSSP